MANPAAYSRGNASMSIQITCTCGRQVRVADALAGSDTDCPACGNTLTIPPMGVLAGAPVSKPPSPLRARPPALTPKKSNSGIGLGPLIGVSIALVLMGVGGWLLWDHWEKSRKEIISPELPSKTEASKDTPVNLVWNLESDKSLFLEITTEGSKKTTTQGITSTEDLKQTFYWQWLPQRQNDGTWKLEQTLEACKLDLTSGIHAIHFDTMKQKHPLKRVLEGAVFQATFDDDWKVLSFSVPTKLEEKLAKADPSLGQIFLMSLDKEKLKSFLERFFSALPAKEMLPGAKWRHDVKLPAFLSDDFFQGQYQYTYQGKKNGLDRIRMDATALTYQASPRLPVKKVEGTPFQTGYVWYDSKLGRIVSVETQYKLEGEVEFNAEAIVESVLRKKTTIKLSGESPLGK